LGHTKDFENGRLYAVSLALTLSI